MLYLSVVGERHYKSRIYTALLNKDIYERDKSICSGHSLCSYPFIISKHKIQISVIICK